MINEENEKTKNIDNTLRNISTEQLKTFGLNYIGYVKQTSHTGQKTYDVYAADGEKIESCTSEEKLRAILFEREINTVTLH